jgi:hypothetical protein
MSTDDENEKQSLEDAIERLEAEHRRRIDEKIERGEAVRAEWPIIVGVPDPEKDYDAVYRDADGREVYPAEPYSVIVTGVPRRGRDMPIDAPPQHFCEVEKRDIVTDPLGICEFTCCMAARKVLAQAPASPPAVSTPEPSAPVIHEPRIDESSDRSGAPR